MRLLLGRWKNGFSNIRFWEDGMAVDWKPSYEFIIPPIHFPLRTIIEKLPLNMSIKSLGFTGRVKSVYRRAPGTLWNANSEPELAASEFDVIRHLVRATELLEEELWFSVLEKGDLNAFVALLLSQLTELRRLHLGLNYYKENEFLYLLLRAAICPHDRSTKLSMFASHQLQRVNNLGNPTTIRMISTIFSICLLSGPWMRS